MSRREELPGFYRDPITGKYFREKPVGVGNPSLRKIKYNNIECSVRRTVGSVFAHLRRRELGSISGVAAEKEYFQVCAKNKSLISSNPVSTLWHYDLEAVHYLKGDETSLFGVWIANNGHELHYVATHKDFADGTPPISYKLHGNVNDIWHSFHVVDVIIYKYPTSRVQFICGRRTEDSEFEVGQPIMTRSDARNVYHSCTGFQREEVTVIGGTNIIDIYKRLNWQYDIQVDGDVFALSSIESSGRLVAGTNHGGIRIYDVNQKKLLQHLEVSTSVINDALYFDENQVIVADSNGMLIKVDLRVNDMVAQYHGHKTTLTKRPFSVANNMLCATGADKVIRLWHISGGNPIHEVKPSLNPENEIRGWLNIDCLYYFEGGFEKQFKF